MSDDAHKTTLRPRFQFVWWAPEWQGVGLRRDTDGLAIFWRWRLLLGWLEIRRWV